MKVTDQGAVMQEAARGELRVNPYDTTWVSRDGERLDLVGRTVSVLLIAYVLLNRLISDRFVLPVGASVRFYELVLVALGLAWVVWMVREPHPFPSGFVGFFGILLFSVLGAAPFLHALTVNAYQANGAERGLFRIFIFSTLFLASFHLAFRLREGFRIVGWIVAATAVQASFGVYEFVTEKPVALLDDFALAIGMIPDPQSIRPDLDGVFLRLSGEVRAVATAPHPIVLSAVIALGVLVAGTWLLYARNGRTRIWLTVAVSILVLALPVTNSRTAFVIVAVVSLPIVMLSIRRLPAILLWFLPALGVLAIAFAISPSTPRLLLNSVTNPENDPNTTVRIERISRVPELLEERPFIGAGYLTHDPQIQTFDNAYNKAVIEFGILGFSLMILFIASALVVTWRGAVAAAPPEVLLPVVGFIAALALFAGAATFDAWTFDQFFPTCLVLLGVGLGRTSVVLHRAVSSRRVDSHSIASFE